MIVVVVLFLVGFSYVEFVFRVNWVGFGYIYMYVVMGEIFVFLIGWCMIIEYVFFVVLFVVVCSEYINFLCNGLVYMYFMEEFGVWYELVFVLFFDFLVFVLVIIVVLIICLGVK